MRLRKVKGATEIVKNSNYTINSYLELKGNFKSLFNNNNSISLEVGMGKGDFIINMAKKYPNINFIGVEKYDSVLVRAIEKIDEDIPNLKFICMDANNIDSVFYKEIDTLYLNFSDPWPKARHKNRRLTSINFLKKYDDIFKSDKKIQFKTDNRGLFEFSIIEFNNYGYKFEEISLDLYKGDIKDNVQTEYEKKFKDKGPIYKIIVKK